MAFNEKVHAYIAAKYYAYLTQTFGERGRKAFVHATQYYAGQRGRRMAQRAIRDGKELDFATYACYGEWASSQEMIDEGSDVKAEMKQLGPDAVIFISRCPWNQQFKEMGLDKTAGAEYCKHLDVAIVNGFNPCLEYRVPETLQTGDHCEHYLKDADYAGKRLAKSPENMRDFEFHCAHSYWAYNEVTAAIFKNEGETINAKILEDFAKDYGKEMADALRAWKNTNFNVCD
ncbi:MULTISPECIES: L-2-amino-thiazoline-4-carboxylic acid hydrolase [unclassified Pyramidobacter]|uniref:L-2-amino-thiazoline-4-carboxylic acid hydrolase n=1 Tax=unclassified Pyramidobacter TaxID=2632171 RepID=UPI00098EAF15|nr:MULTISPECIES: L-2-amino-thiazoline-4-carboxylic acid hydrolase [unclassified Pyramidobacter]MCI7402894.1 L-2-amino-thiazoline-4-carboxylic acid hydrolase [Pyramidobacter sp.]MDY3213582.1 L-2-amino-thiazoline-4-carboxylic acid hydrolase [Pyramidobacter sp.]OON87127.1 hypothetical protein B0D78_10705 [Pyramidobacter sp. C12-8]WOL40083.1 L-2-amino-thiazoline-4-carboxylic acid hydrolase [Pyramidobacter sp. YE332]